MAVQRFKVAINNAVFPLLSKQAQRAATVPGLDSAPRTPRVFMGADDSADYNMTQLIYAENVMPSTAGFRSVGYRELFAGNAGTEFDAVFPLRDAEENTVLYSPSGGLNYILRPGGTAWESVPSVDIFPSAFAAPETLADSRITYAYVDGKTFVCYSEQSSAGGSPEDYSIMFWDGTDLVPAGALIQNLPFAPGTIGGIAGSNGYLVIWSDISVAWAPFNGAAFNFEIYENGEPTGASYQTPEDVKGKIRALVSVAGGFLIFTDKNCVAANYHAQSTLAPWIFKEVGNAGGLESYEQATVEGTLNRIYAYTTAGFQRISLNSAETIWPAVADFITGRQIEDINPDTLLPEYQDVTLDLFTLVTNVANRYVVVSIGTFPRVYHMALVYDIALERWGKLKITHRDCFYYAYGATDGELTYGMLNHVPYSLLYDTSYEDMQATGNAFVAAQHALAFLGPQGEITLADWSLAARDTEDPAIAVIGRVQLSRASHIQFNRIEIDGFKQGEVCLQPSYNGHTPEPAMPLIDVGSAENFGHFGELIDCKNFNIVLKGTWEVSTLVVEATTTGKY